MISLQTFEFRIFYFTKGYITNSIEIHHNIKSNLSKLYFTEASDQLFFRSKLFGLIISFA